MRALLGMKRSYLMRMVSLLLIGAVLVAGVMGCEPVEYTLGISSSEGGTVTAPGEGTSVYNRRTVVNLVAEAEAGYRFVNWTGDVDTVDDVYASRTNITMLKTCYITANFEELDPGTVFAGGNGTAADPYQISNWNHLHNVRHYLNDHFVLISDLRVTSAGYSERAGRTANEGMGWLPVGDRYYWDGEQWVPRWFEGTFDGQGYDISGMFINRPDREHVGLFGWTEGHIADVGVIAVDVTGWEQVGSVAGTNRGTVTNCYATGRVNGESYGTGGLAGSNHGHVSRSYSSCSVDGFQVVGGLVGFNTRDIVNCYATGTVTGGAIVGGVAGYNIGHVFRSYASSSVSAIGAYVGGVAGRNSGCLEDTYGTGDVTGGRCVGGLVGSNWAGNVSNCHSSGDVRGGTMVGGLVGYDLMGTIDNSYSTGSVSGENAVGGLVGAGSEGSLVGDSFWDVEASMIGVSEGGAGKTTAEMMDITTFTDTATEGLDEPWDLVSVQPGETHADHIWNIVDGQTYPFLSWQSL